MQKKLRRFKFQIQFHFRNSRDAKEKLFSESHLFEFLAEPKLKRSVQDRYHISRLIHLYLKTGFNHVPTCGMKHERITRSFHAKEVI